MCAIAKAGGLLNVTRMISCRGEQESAPSAGELVEVTRRRILFELGSARIFEIAVADGDGFIT
jgi:hypothetical protein